MSGAKVVGIIPARYGSSRLPGKPLAMIAGKPMIQRVYEQCGESKTLASICVATDDARIVDAVAAFGGVAVLTRGDHPNGTDRAAEVAESIDADIVVNLQGDQPFLSPVMIDEAVQPLLDDPGLGLATLRYRITRPEDLANPGVVKVVVDLSGRALYFSRSLIPYPREALEHGVYEHVGAYAYRRETLLQVARLAPTPLERLESLEQLRWIEHGLVIHVAETKVADQEFHGFSVDTPEDLARAESMILERGLS